jgi:hypothetical protein
MFGPTRANQLLSRIAEQQAKAKDSKGGQVFVGEGEAVVRMELFSELAMIVAEQAKDIEQLKSYVNQRLTALAESREREM